MSAELKWHMSGPARRDTSKVVPRVHAEIMTLDLYRHDFSPVVAEVYASSFIQISIGWCLACLERKSSPRLMEASPFRYLRHIGCIVLNPFEKL